MAALARQLAEHQRAAEVVEQLAQIGSFHWTLGTEVVDWSAQARRILGRGPEGAPATMPAYLALVHPDDRAELNTRLQMAVQYGGEYDVRHRLILGTDVRRIRSMGRVDGGRAVTGSIQDVTETDGAARELQESRDRLAAVLDGAVQQAIIATDPDGAITIFSRGAERLLGYTADEMLHTDLGSLLKNPGVEQTDAGGLFAKAAAGEPDVGDWMLRPKSGPAIPVLITVSAIRDSAGAVTGFITVGTDITGRVRDQAELRASEARFRDTFEYAPHGIMLISVDSETLGRFLEVNPALCRLTGYSSDQLVTMRVADVTHPDDVAAHLSRFAAFTSESVADAPHERRWRHAGGKDLWVQVSASPVRRGPTGRFVVGQVEDITDRKRAEAKLLHQALHDWLTGLPNRVLLMDRIEHALAAAHRTGKAVAVLYIDLDGFKTINDTGGHAAGDDALVAVAHRLRHAVRPGDTVARLGGDEFVVVCEDLSGSDAAELIAERLLAAIRQPHEFAGRRYLLDASVGLAMSGSDRDPARLLHAADEAMYLGKTTGRGRVLVSRRDSREATAPRGCRRPANIRMRRAWPATDGEARSVCAPGCRRDMIG